MKYSPGTNFFCVALSCFLVSCAAATKSSSPGQKELPAKASQSVTNQGAVPLIISFTNCASQEKSKTWADVSDNAVTLGLSALVGGGIGLLASWLSSRRDARLEYLKRKRELIEAILEKFDEFAEAQSAYWTNLINAVFKRDKNDPIDPLTKKDRAVLGKSEQKLFETYLLLLRCRSKLSLVGEKAAVKSLNEVKTVSDDFFKTANIDNPRCTEEFLKQAKEKMLAGRGQFYDALHNAFTRKSA